jgi:hypothetical protein
MDVINYVMHQFAIGNWEFFPFVFLGLWMLAGIHFFLKHRKTKSRRDANWVGILLSLAVIGALAGEGVDTSFLLFANMEGLIGLVTSLTLTSLYFRFQYELPAGSVLKYLGMPIGFIISTISAIDLIQVDQKFVTSLTPAVFGAIISALFVDRELPRVLLPRWSRNLDLVVFCLIVLTSTIVTAENPVWILAHPYAWFVAIGCAGMVFFFLNQERELETKLLEASLFGLLICVAISTLIYISVILTCSDCSPTDDRKGGAVVLCHILFSLFLYLVALQNSMVKGSTEKLVRSNWHVAEGYVFILFIFFEPRSLISF